MSKRNYYNEDKTAVLIVDTDGKEAYLKLSDKTLFFDENEIARLIENAGIKHGFENARRYQSEHNMSKKQGQPFLIARYTPPVNFDFEHKLFIDKNEMLPANYQDNMSLPEIMKKLSIEAHRELSTIKITGKGEKGIDIFGKEIDPLASEEELAGKLCGRGVAYKDEKIISTARGFPVFDDNARISVFSTINIEADVELGSDYYYLPCNLSVKGKISGNAILDIEGDFYVDGDVYQCSVHVSGSICVEGLVEDAVFTADKDITINKSLQSRICSGNNLYINNDSLRSLLVGEHSVSAENTDCTDCSIFASHSISAGSFYIAELEKSSLNLRYSPYLWELLALRQKIKQKQESGKLHNISNDYLQDRINETRKKLIAEFPEARKDEEGNKLQRADDYADCYITIKRHISEGSGIRIFPYSLKLADDREGVVFKVDDDKLVPSDLLTPF